MEKDRMGIKTTHVDFDLTRVLGRARLSERIRGSKLS